MGHGKSSSLLHSIHQVLTYNQGNAHVLVSCLNHCAFESKTMNLPSARVQSGFRRSFHTTISFNALPFFPPDHKQEPMTSPIDTGSPQASVSPAVSCSPVNSPSPMASLSPAASLKEASDFDEWQTSESFDIYDTMNV